MLAGEETRWKAFVKGMHRISPKASKA